MGRPTATPGTPITQSVLGSSLDLRSLDKTTGNTWQHNVILKNGRFDVRKGFGLLAAHSTDFTASRTETGATLNPELYRGYTRHLGSEYFTGANALVSVLEVSGFPASLREDSLGVVSGIQARKFIVVRYHDLNTNKSIEIPLQDTLHLNVLDRKPLGSTTYNVDNSRLVSHSGGCSFLNILGLMVIVLHDHSLWVVAPLNVTSETTSRLQNQDRDAPLGSLGDPLVRRLLVRDGSFIEFTYLAQQEFTKPRCMTSWNNRLIVSSGRRILFSDPDSPGTFLADNQIVIPTSQEVLGLKCLGDLLYVFSATETWLYQPSDGEAIVTAGRWIQASATVGTANPNASVVGGSAVITVDLHGVHVVNQTQISLLSEPIDPWFRDKVQNPWLHYTQAGQTTTTNEQPPAWYDLASEVAQARVFWHNLEQTLIVNLPSLALVHNQGWSTMQVGSAAKSVAGVPVVGWNSLQTQFVPGLSLYAVALGAEAVSGDVHDTPFLVAEYGRGGALDFSYASDEDRRVLLSGFSRSGVGTNIARVGQPVRMPSGWRTPNQTTSQTTWLVPVSVQSNATIESINFRLIYDQANWRVLTNPNGVLGEVDFITDRALREGFQPGAPDAAHQVRLYAAGIPSATGSEVRMDLWGFGKTWSQAPNLMIPDGQDTTLLWLPMQATSSATLLTHGFSLTATINPTTVPVACATDIWNGTTVNDGNPLSTIPVDWMIRSAYVDVGDQVKVRSTFVTQQSSGQATNRSPAGWLGTLCLSLDSDYRAYSSFDASAASLVQEGMDTVRDRLVVNNVPVQPVYGQARWSSTGDWSKGNILIADPAVDRVASSQNIRGEQFAVTVFGTIADPAESQSVQDVTINAVVVGGRRKTGR